jgi:hypothetical protein
MPHLLVDSRAIKDQTQSISYGQLLQQKLQKCGWSVTFDVECTGPQHAQLWSGSLWIQDMKIGQSSWHSSKDAAKEEAAWHSLAWFNTYRCRYQCIPHELLQHRLAEYGWASTLSVEWTESQDAWQWSATFWIGRIKIGQSSSHDSESAAKDEAAQRAIEWCEMYRYQGRQPSSYQELLQHRTQNYELAIKFFRNHGDPPSDAYYQISYWIGGYKIGDSG